MLKKKSEPAKPVRTSGWFASQRAVSSLRKGFHKRFTAEIAGFPASLSANAYSTTRLSRLTAMMFGMNGIQADFVRAASKQDFVEALDRRHVDVVISDSSVAGIKPLRALHLAKQRHPTAAFFILSGRITPTQAAIARNAGVNASIDKRAIEKLVPLMQEAIELRVRKPTGQGEE